MTVRVSMIRKGLRFGIRHDGKTAFSVFDLDRAISISDIAEEYRGRVHCAVRGQKLAFVRYLTGVNGGPYLIGDRIATERLVGIVEWVR